MKKIDIVIPAYKAQDTIGRTLASIAQQSIADQIRVTIVNDADGIGYKKVVNQFKNFVEVHEIELAENGGPGVARQTGLAFTQCPYITFIDADDTFSGPFSVEVMLMKIEENPKYVVSVGAFLEQQVKDKPQFNPHANDMIWVFGKLYKREFLTKYQIQFSSTRSNEDTGFNTIVRLCTNENELINYYQDVVYVWWFKEDSITRINNFEYSYNQSFTGYTENMVYAIKHARKVNPFNSYIDKWSIQTMANLYIYFMKTKFRDPRFLEQNFESCKYYYNEIFKEIEERIEENQILPIIAETLANQMVGLTDFIIDATFYDFIQELKPKPKPRTTTKKKPKNKRHSK